MDNLLLNILFMIFGGWSIAIEYFTGGVALCCTIVGIPMGLQCFKLGIAVLLPFGKKVVSVEQSNTAGCLSLIGNVVWILFGGIWLFFTHLFWGMIACITIIGIPIGLQHFKLMKLAFAPFGKDFVEE